MIELTTIRDLVAIFGVIAGFSYYVLTVRTNQKNQEISIRNQELALYSQELTRKAQEQALLTRQAQLFMPIYAKFHDREFMKAFIDVMVSWEWESFEDFQRKYGIENLDAYSRLIMIIDYFEGIGVLVRRDLIDVSFIDDLFSSVVIMFWEKISGFIVEYRIQRNVPQFAEQFEYLYNVVKEIAEEQNPELKKGMTPIKKP